MHTIIYPPWYRLSRPGCLFAGGAAQEPFLHRMCHCTSNNRAVALPQPFVPACRLANVAAANAKEISDARLSYPSGHSAYIFYSATMLSLYLLGKTRVLVEHRPGHFLIASLCLIPMGVAAFVAVSRIADYKHDPSDVNAGSFIGIMCGAFGYMLNFDVLRAQAWCRQRQ